ncbi:MAG: hypothetical protein ABL925_17280 [Methylococcales bacterium]
MNLSNYLSLAVASLALSVSPVNADANKTCRLAGAYGYLYNGASFQADASSMPLTETGVFTVQNNGSWLGEGTMALQFTDFSGKGPLWLLVKEVQSGGVATADSNNPCFGVMTFTATATVIKTSNSAILPEGTVLFSDKPRSIAYTISGQNNDIVDLISTSPGTVASGTAHKQLSKSNRRNEH